MDEAAGAGTNSGFQPKEEIINTLLSLGFSRNSAIKVILISFQFYSC